MTTPITRSKAAASQVSSLDEFFQSVPQPTLREQMRGVIIVYLDEQEKAGKALDEPSFKKSLRFKIAEQLRDQRIGGWAHLQMYHLDGRVYSMFKSMIDLANNELRLKITSEQFYTPGELQHIKEDADEKT